uniref:PPM-type phosphatase domain-containing protein n=2 Tax=Salix viminalis TaxID=40686 RepID=A0A6N2LPP5_SALVM
MGIYLSSPKREKFSEEGGKGRLRYGLSSMQGWRATMEDAFEEVADYGSQESDFMGSSHAAITDLDATTSFLVFMMAMESDFIVFLADLCLCPYMNKVKVIAAMFNSSKVVAKFSCKFLHQHVLKNEEHAAGDIGTSVQKAFFRLLDFITKEFFLSPSRRVVEVSSKGGGTPSQPGFDTRDELIGQTPQPVAPAVPAIPSSQKPLPLTTSVQILDEALQCVEELKDPAFHPEVTISLALEKSPPCVGPVIKLLEFLLTKKVLTARDIGTGLDFEVLKELLEKLEDNRFRKAIFEEHQLKPFRARSVANTVMGIYLSSPKKEKFSEDGGNGRLRYGLSSMQGWRATMEDAHAAIIDLDATTSFFGVYNCHGGKNCKFQSDFIVSLADLWLCPYMNKVKVIAAMFNSSEQKIRLFRRYRNFCPESIFQNGRDDAWPERLEGIGSFRCGGSNEQPHDWAFEEGPHSDFSGPTCGCTACVVIIRNNQLIVANAGTVFGLLDPTTLLLPQLIINLTFLQAYSLSRDHKPDLEAEKERILKAGGCIHAGRSYSGSPPLDFLMRSDVDFKQNKFFPVEKQIVTANPDINTVELCDDIDFLVLACDGISV